MEVAHCLKKNKPSIVSKTWKVYTENKPACYDRFVYDSLVLYIITFRRASISFSFDLFSPSFS
jgi:hypothetical protein